MKTTTIAPAMIPHLKGTGLALEFPNGSAKDYAITAQACGQASLPAQLLNVDGGYQA
jgi:hypothetical protein